ncbi:MAG: hypothetical protein IKS19_05365 [Clostridia bacterium]|nr:hypothetical protein [Clostridia bacterium]
MVKLIVGNKGSGKTKILLNMCKEACDTSKGYVALAEKGKTLFYDVDRRARLIDFEDYGIRGFDMLYGFISGISAGNYDFTDIFVDSTLKIGGRDYNELAEFLKKFKKLSELTNTNFIFTISCAKEELPEGIDAEYVN